MRNTGRPVSVSALAQITSKPCVLGSQRNRQVKHKFKIWGETSTGSSSERFGQVDASLAFSKKAVAVQSSMRSRIKAGVRACARALGAETVHILAPLA